MLMRLDLDGQRVGVGEHQGAGGGFAGDDDRDVDGDLLAAADQQQVDVLDVVAQRMADDGLRQRQLVAVGELQGQHRVGAALERVREVAGRQRQVPRVGAVAVQDGGDLAGAAGSPGTTLAELGADFGKQANLRHCGLLESGDR